MTKAIRVLQVAYNVVPASGGTTTAILDFHQALGGDVLSFTDPSAARETLPLEPEHVEIGSGPLGRLYGFASPGALVTANSIADAADLIVIHGLLRHCSHWAWQAAIRRNIPYWVIPHGVLDPYVFTYRRARKKVWMRTVGYPILRGADAVIFATSRELERARPHLGGTRTVVIPWPIEALKPPRQGPEPGIRERLGLPQEARLLLFLGRLHNSKRITETLEALSASATPHVHLLLAGPVGAEFSLEECRGHIRQLGLEGRAHLIGAFYDDAKARLLAEVDGFISLSAKENFGYTVAEALAAGLPVILSPGIDLVPELENVDCGWLLETFDTEEAASAIRDFSQASAERLRSKGAKGRAWAERELTPDRFGSALSELARVSVSKTTRPVAPTLP